MSDNTENVIAERPTPPPPNPWHEIGYVLETGERTHYDLEEFAADLRKNGQKVRLVLLKHD